MTDPAGRVSVVVPTYNRGPGIERLLRALAAQEGIAGFEVVVSDDGSSDGTPDRVRELAADLPFDLKVIDGAGNTGPAGARNRGWCSASGDLIVFTDDDVNPEPHWLAAMVSGFADGDIVVGRTRPPEDQLDLIGPFSHHLDMGHNGRYSTCNIAYRRSLLEELGGFDETFLVPNGEDMDLGLRAVAAGGRVAYVEQALVWHEVRGSDFRAALRSLGRLDGIVTLLARHPDARPQLGAGWFLTKGHKAVMIGWAAAALVAARPGRPSSWLVAGAAGALYARRVSQEHPPRRPSEWLTALPLAVVYDSAAVATLARFSLRHRTFLL
jgi:hypothetical protein